ncbi:hypothetical protein [Kibdelosporangium aridum]|uniref:Uncharacterized protein n=1 Tax=Kibdelosporangium aridum TaxID=2030 RepID=A0A1W2EYM0_KIBAR|nr:hypothetical protein [Kibdelosporangium aridum]SMD14764.1 hypothetical protein SAMN05661093_05114 [Kibdelosporangium aridum]
MPNLQSPSQEPDNRKEGDNEQPHQVEPTVRDDGEATERAVVRFEREDLKVEVDIPGRHTGGLLEVLRWAVGTILAAAGPALTLNALPEGFPAWMCFTLVLIQLVVTVYVVRTFGRGGAHGSK